MNPVLGRRKVRTRAIIATDTAAAHRKILEGRLSTRREREATGRVTTSRTGKDRDSRDDYGDGILREWWRARMHPLRALRVNPSSLSRWEEVEYQIRHFPRKLTPVLVRAAPALIHDSAETHRIPKRPMLDRSVSQHPMGKQ